MPWLLDLFENGGFLLGWSEWSVTWIIEPTWHAWILGDWLYLVLWINSIKFFYKNQDIQVHAQISFYWLLLQACSCPWFHPTHEQMVCCTLFPDESWWESIHLFIQSTNTCQKSGSVSLGLTLSRAWGGGNCRCRWFICEVIPGSKGGKVRQRRTEITLMSGAQSSVDVLKQHVDCLALSR